MAAQQAVMTTLACYHLIKMIWKTCDRHRAALSFIQSCVCVHLVKFTSTSTLLLILVWSLVLREISASLAIKCSTMYQSFCAEVSWQQCLEARLMRTVVQNQTFDAAGLKIITMSWKMPKSSIKLTVTTECGYNYLWVHHYEHYMLSLEPLLI